MRNPSNFFNVKYYLNNNPTVKNNDIEPLQHYIKYGWRKMINFSKHSSKKYYLINPKSEITRGLCNQLYNIVAGIIIGIFNNRNIVIKDFYPDLKLNNTVPISQIIDLEYLNKFLISYNIKILDYYEIEENINWVKTSHENLFCIDEFFDENNFLKSYNLIKSEKNKYINLEQTFLSSIFTNKYLLNTANLILFNIKFANIFYEIKNICKFNLDLDQYNVIHLRMEDDLINHLNNVHINSIENDPNTECIIPKNERNKFNLKFNPSQSIINLYNLKISEYINKKVYISTYLLKNVNVNDFYLINLNKNNKNIIRSYNWREKYRDFLKGREIDAIIDILISIDGENFLGLESSTFSQIISKMYMLNNKNFYLLNVKDF
jgi:hypothetical protein